MNRRNLILLAAAVALAIVPLLLPLTEGQEEPFSGADGQAMAAIDAAHPDYQPWFEPLWEPPSGEIESLLFSLQAALGAGVIGYYFGFRRGRRGADRSAEDRSGRRDPVPNAGD